MSGDTVEFEYARAITAACGRGDSDAAHELSIGLSQYRELYKLDPGAVRLDVPKETQE